MSVIYDLASIDSLAPAAAVPALVVDAAVAPLLAAAAVPALVVDAAVAPLLAAAAVPAPADIVAAPAAPADLVALAPVAEDLPTQVNLAIVALTAVRTQHDGALQGHQHGIDNINARLHISSVASVASTQRIHAALIASSAQADNSIELRDARIAHAETTEVFNTVSQQADAAMAVRRTIRDQHNAVMVAEMGLQHQLIDLTRVTMAVETVTAHLIASDTIVANLEQPEVMRASARVLRARAVVQRDALRAELAALRVAIQTELARVPSLVGNLEQTLAFAAMVYQPH